MIFQNIFSCSLVTWGHKKLSRATWSLKPVTGKTYYNLLSRNTTVTPFYENTFTFENRKLIIILFWTISHKPKTNKHILQPLLSSQLEKYIQAIKGLVVIMDGKLELIYRFPNCQTRFYSSSPTYKMPRSGFCCQKWSSSLT